MTGVHLSFPSLARALAKYFCHCLRRIGSVTVPRPCPICIRVFCTMPLQGKATKIYYRLFHVVINPHACSLRSPVVVF